MMLCQVTQKKYWKSNKPESCYVKWVNTLEGCWYHRQQDHGPSLTLSNQMKWQNVTPLPLFLFPAMILEDAQQYTWISFCQMSQHPRRMLVPLSTRPRSQFNAEQSNEMARRHPSPPVSLSGNNIGRCPAINLNLILSKESTPTMDVGTTVDRTTIQV